jgi:hypothetical protein
LTPGGLNVRTEIIAVLAAVFVTTAAADQPASKTHNPEEQRVLAVEQSWIKAEVEHDQGTLMRVLDPNFVVTSGSGKPIDKAAFIAEAMRFTFASQKVAHDVVHVDHHTAVIVGTDTVFPSDSTQKIMTVRYTTMYVKRNGNWVAIAEQMNLMPAVSDPAVPAAR